MITSKGLLRPTYRTLLERQISRAKELFGEDINTEETTPLGKFIRIQVYDLAVAYEQLEKAYFARFPNTAFGISLDRLCPFAGIRRNPPTAAQHLVEFVGTPGFAVPLETLVSTSDNVTFYTDEEIILDPEGKGQIRVCCTELGTKGNVAIGEIVAVMNPIPAIASIEHKKVLSLGEEVESDASLRSRWKQAIAGSGSANAAAIKAEILRVPNIESVTVIENDQDFPDEMGRPPHTFESYVLGDATKDEEIAKAIFRKKPIGIKAHGKITVPVLDEDGTIREIRFTRSEEIYLKVLVKARVNNTFEGENGKKEIAGKLSDYVMGLGNGGDVIHSSLYGYIHSVTGVLEVTELLISFDGGTTYQSENIVCSPWQVARLLTGDVTVEVNADA